MALAISIGSCASAKTTELDAAGAALRGMVYNENRMPVSDVKVRRKGDDSGTTALTDIHGRYFFSDMPYGPVTLEFEKDGYEPVTWGFDFNTPTQVVYVQMTNLDELLDDAATSIQKRDWKTATSYLDRIRKMESDNSIASYLESEMLSRQGKDEEAAALLEGLSAGKDGSFVVELSLADLYQNALGQPDKALAHLRKALTIQDDSDVQSRIEALEKK
jgi:tetratricopeptide (TPR) repeat protein